jgi:hypothetical protein
MAAIVRQVLSSGADRWVLLTYHLPREPSTPRIALWRKLRRLGAIQLLSGLVALPLDARNRQQLEWLAEEVVEVGGEANTWIAEPTAVAEQRVLRRRVLDAAAEEYRELIARAEAAADEDAQARGRTLGKLRRELQQVRRRDYFHAPERERAERALGALADALGHEVAS